MTPAHLHPIVVHLALGFALLWLVRGLMQGVIPENDPVGTDSRPGVEGGIREVIFSSALSRSERVGWLWPGIGPEPFRAPSSGPGPFTNVWDFSRWEGYPGAFSGFRKRPEALFSLA